MGVSLTQDEPVILAFDTSAAHCAAALLRGDHVIATCRQDMSRGQAERLFPLLQEMLDGAALTWRDLAALGVGIGPGNFTGIRISVAAARGLALALDIPAIGISTLDAIREGQDKAHLAVVPAPQDKVYIAPDDQPPALVTLAEAQAAGLPLAYPPEGAALAVAIGHLARHRLAQGAPWQAPAPLYIRAPDAAPSRDTPPVMLADPAAP